MNWQTLSVSIDPPAEQAGSQIGFVDMRKGLVTIVLGYLLIIAMVLSMAGLIWYVVSEILGHHPTSKAVESASTYLFAGVLLGFLAYLFSLYLIVRGKWICLMSAPEQFNAKWFVYVSILCIVMGPVLSISSSFLGESKEVKSRASKDKSITIVLSREIEDYKRGVTSLGPTGYLKLAGNVASLLSSVFFVLFLRAVSFCCNDVWRVRFAELFLLFNALLVCGVVVFLLNPTRLLARPGLLLGLAGGTLFSMIWYFLLILSTIGSISNILASRR